jgi:hypothetical protein
MANRIYRDFNFIVLEQDSIRIDFPIVDSYYVYNYTNQTYEIHTFKAAFTSVGIIEISDISTYKNELGVAYDESLLLAFLRQYASLTDKIPAPIIPPTVPILPSGTYIPKNSISGAFDLLWVGATGNVMTSDGGIIKTTGSGSWNGSAYSLIDHNGDFSLNFKFDFSISGSDDQFGISFYKSRVSFENLDFAFYRSGGNVSIWENGMDKGGATVVSDSDVYTIQRESMQIHYKINGSNIRTVDITNNGAVNLDCSLFDYGEIKDIEVIIP